MASESPGAEPAEPAAGHLDQDAEAFEDPVHEGDARHQKAQHEHEHGPPGQPPLRDEDAQLE